MKKTLLSENNNQQTMLHTTCSVVVTNQVFSMDDSWDVPNSPHCRHRLGTNMISAPNTFQDVVEPAILE